MEKAAADQEAVAAFDARCQEMSGALIAKDERFKPGGALRKQLEDAWWRSKVGKTLQRAAMADPEFNPFELLAAKIVAEAEAGLQKGLAMANANRVRQTGAAAATARPGSAAAGAGTNDNSPEATTAVAAALARSQGEEVSADQVARYAKILANANM